MATNHKTLPIDAQSAASLDQNGLRLTLVDTDDKVAFERWAQAAASKFGYVEVEHRVELFGLCAGCAALER